MVSYDCHVAIREPDQLTTGLFILYFYFCRSTKPACTLQMSVTSLKFHMCRCKMNTSVWTKLSYRVVIPAVPLWANCPNLSGSTFRSVFLKSYETRVEVETNPRTTLHNSSESLYSVADGGGFKSGIASCSWDAIFRRLGRKTCTKLFIELVKTSHF